MAAFEIEEVLCDWRDYALCDDLAFHFEADENPFFQLGRGSTYDVARGICSGCLVVVDCLIDSLEEPVGMFGCTSKNERDSIKRSIRLGKPFIKSVEQVWQAHRRNLPDRAPPKSVWKEWS